MKFFIKVTAAILMVLFLSGNCYALTTMLNSIPTADIVAHKTFSLLGSYYKFNYMNSYTFDTASPIYGLEYGFNKFELGLDYIQSDSFTRNGLYNGRYAGNFKWRILTQGTDAVSLAVGVMSLGSKNYSPAGNWQYYKPAPYFIFTKAYTDCRLHLGYQMNGFGFAKADGKNSNSILAGIDGTIYKHPKHPITLMVDYIGGPMALYGIGFYQPINPKLTWAYSFYKPQKHFANDGTEYAPKQHFISLTYTFQLK